LHERSWTGRGKTVGANERTVGHEFTERRWFKGLGSLCRGTVLTAVDITLLGGMWALPLSPDTTIVGSVASIATGLGDIAIGIGEFRDE
jgi:hypothetical protein